MLYFLLISFDKMEIMLPQKPLS